MAKKLSLVLIFLMIAACAAVNQSPVVDKDGLIDLIASGDQALEANNVAKATEILKTVLSARVFSRLDADMQQKAYVIAGLAAGRAQDFKRAHKLMASATKFEGTTGEIWYLNATFALHADALPDAAQAIKKVAVYSPEQLRTDKGQRLIWEIVRRLGESDRTQVERLSLIETLYQTNFVDQYGIQPDTIWVDLVRQALTQKNLPRAREIMTRIESVSALLRMKVDDRFLALVEAEPERFELASAARRTSSSLASVVDENPHLLGAFVEYGYALLEEGRFDKVLADADAILENIAAGGASSYDDTDESLAWVYNHKAAALRALGRWEEALVVMEIGSGIKEGKTANVSQVINLAAHYVDAGHSEKALAITEQFACADHVSAYGCLLLHAVRHSAHLQLRDAAKARKAFAYLQEHRAVSDRVWLRAILLEKDFDFAAALLIEQLQDPDKRHLALVDLQNYLPLAMTPVMQQERKLWTQLLARADVAAAIDKVGRRLNLPIYSVPP